MIPELIISSCLAYNQIVWYSVYWHYNYKTNIITICSEDTKEQKKETYIHEFWHYVWRKKLTEEDKKEYQDAVNQYNWIWWDLYYHPSEPWLIEDWAIMFSDIFYNHNLKDYKEIKKIVIKILQNK